MAKVSQSVFTWNRLTCLLFQLLHNYIYILFEEKKNTLVIFLIISKKQQGYVKLSL